MFSLRASAPVSFVRTAAAGLLVGMIGLGAGSAAAAEYKKKQSVAAVQTPETQTSGAGETATGTVATPADGVGKDCFVTRKRAFVPGTGYIIRKSTFCN